MLGGMAAPRLLDPAMLESCLEALRCTAIEAGNISGASRAAGGDHLTNFLAWHAASERDLSSLLVPEDLHCLLYSPR